MSTVSIRHLADHASRIMRDVQATRRPLIVTNRGEPVAAIIPVDADGLSEAIEDWVLANAAEYVNDMRDADEDVAAGRTTPLHE